VSAGVVDREAALEHALSIAITAGEGIARIYASEFAVEYKGHDDPVTVADRDANALICAALEKLYPGVPIVAEESDPATFAGFATEPVVWFVDPLDGTREFVARNGEFAVMIGLAEAGRATLGVLVAPALGRIWIGGEGLGAFEVMADGTRAPIRVSTRATLADAEVLVSRSRQSDRSRDAVARLGARRVTLCGGAGIKGARIACGEADIYAQAGRSGKLWDGCAPEAIVRAAGGEWTDGFGDRPSYATETLQNERGVLATNGLLHAAALAVARTLD
jgi:3'(2'), 5'-bisphosphate nucleotidase